MVAYRSLLGPVILVLLVGAAMLWSPFEPHRPPAEGAGPSPQGAWPEDDWAVFEQRVRWAVEKGLDTVPLSTAMAEIGRSFVGTAYVPRTLEVEGPERLVIDFLGLDCVTFVENVFALSRFVGSGGAARIANRAEAEAMYGSLLTELRYRDGIVDGYPSRLHYFSDWVADNARRGLVYDISGDLGGVRDDEPIDFMTTHVEAYRQLAGPANVERVREAEARLSASGRVFVPAEHIGAVVGRIRDGDIIAATSTVAGLDVAHTGLALWVDGTLRLMHAPLVGDSVQISETPLAERILGIEGQDGIIVARPLQR